MPTFASTNLFLLDTCPRTAAALHCDQHVVDMAHSVTQLLYCALKHWDLRRRIDTGTYKVPGDCMHHPCVLWAAACRAHFGWTLKLALALVIEHQARFKLSHPAQEDVERIAKVWTRVAPARWPARATVAQWTQWLHKELRLGEAHVTDLLSMASTLGAPHGTAFGVAWVEPRAGVLVLSYAEHAVELVESYRRLYAFIDRVQAPMRWCGRCGARSVPEALTDAFIRYALDEPRLVEQLGTGFAPLEQARVESAEEWRFIEERCAERVARRDADEKARSRREIDEAWAMAQAEVVEQALEVIIRGCHGGARAVGEPA